MIYFIIDFFVESRQKLINILVIHNANSLKKEE